VNVAEALEERGSLDGDFHGGPRSDAAPRRAAQTNRSRRGLHRAGAGKWRDCVDSARCPARAVDKSGFYSMMPKSGYRFSENIMLQQQPKA
jgi:hypothetical protein